MPKKYKIIGPNAGNYPVGTTCYEYLQHDYGVAGDDSRLLGETFVSVTLNTNGGPPSFTIRERHLEEIVDPVATVPLERAKLYAELLPRVRAVLERHGCPADTIDDVAIGVAREISIDRSMSEWLLAELQRIHRPN